MIHLTATELPLVARRATGADVVVRDHGLLEAAAARPRTTVMGADAYPDLATKVAALFHSLARSHPLVDGHKRLALAGAIAYAGVNGSRLTLTNDEAYDLTVAVATGALDDVDEIAALLRRALAPR